MTVVMPAGVQTARDLVGPAIAEAVGRLSPAVRTVASYHLGLADAAGQPIAAGGTGKALRPALALLSARAAGAGADRAVVPAAAVELVHNFSLLHDDIMDGDIERRHQPTAWTVFGVGAAILAGDALLALAQDILLETPPYGVWAARLPIGRGAAPDRGPGLRPGVRAPRRRAGGRVPRHGGRQDGRPAWPAPAASASSMSAARRVWR